MMVREQQPSLGTELESARLCAMFNENTPRDSAPGIESFHSVSETIDTVCNHIILIYFS